MFRKMLGCTLVVALLAASQEGLGFTELVYGLRLGTMHYNDLIIVLVGVCSFSFLPHVGFLSRNSAEIGKRIILYRSKQKTERGNIK
jgi:hypothetical protein